MADRFLDVPGARLAYDVDEREGGGTLVVLHGLTESRRDEDESGVFGRTQIARVRQRVVRYDARGHGRSTGRPEPEDWRWSALAGDLLAVLDEVAPGEQVDGLGVSMGTGTLVAAAVQQPERFRRLALTIPPTAWATRPASQEQNRAAARFVEERGLGALEAAAGTLPPLPVLEDGGWWPLPSPDLVETLAPAVFRGAALADLPAEDLVRERMTMPVLLLPWADDPGHPVSTAQRLHELLPQSQLQVARTADDVRAWPELVAGFLTDAASRGR